MSERRCQMHPRMPVRIAMGFLVALDRLIPPPPNFTPIGAVALFGAAFFRNKWMAFLVPLAALFLSDVALEITTNLGFTSGWLATGRGFHEGMWVVYGTMALIVVLGMLMLRKKMVVTVAGAVLAGSAVFFGLTNFA